MSNCLCRMTRMFHPLRKTQAALLVGVLSLAGLVIIFEMWRLDQPQPQTQAWQDELRRSEDAESESLRFELLGTTENVSRMITINVEAQEEIDDDKDLTPVFYPIPKNFFAPPVIQRPRVVEMRKKLITISCSDGIERFVKDALKWLCEHQQPDGGWSFDLRGGICANRCDHPGTLKNSRYDATGLALLAFLGAGYTHLEGSYKQPVNAGLTFLVASPDNDIEQDVAHAVSGLSLDAIGTLALCESYAMTRDERLKRSAQEAIQRLAQASRPVSGTNPPNDHRTDAWLLMALKSGHAADLQVPVATWNALRDVFDVIPSEFANGTPGLIDPNGSESQIAAQSFARLLLARDHDAPTLQQAVARIAARGPVKTDLEYDFFATQTLHHWREVSPDENRMWIAWHRELQDWLLGNQETQGHRKGSLFINDRRADDGGRLYCTAMAVMILEVYYRHLPIYRETL